MKIAYIIPTLNLGGAEKQQINIINGLSNNYEIKLYILKNETQLLSQIDNKSIDIVVCNINTMYNIKSFLNFIKDLIKFKPNIIHSHMYNANLVSRFIKIILPASKLINHVHGLSDWMSKPKLFIDRISSKLVDKFIVVSDKSLNIRINREKYPEKKIVLLYNSVNLNKFDTNFKFDLNKNNLTIGLASRLIPIKNIKAALYMFSFLKNKGLNVKLKIAGDGPDKQNLINYTKELNIESDVTFLGFTNDMYDFFKSIDIYCISSTSEDLPLSLIEAMMSGKPIIASNIGGIPFVLNNLKFTKLVNNFYDEKELEDIYSMLKGCNNKKCAEYLNNIAINNYDNSVYCTKLEKIYEDLK